MSDQSPILGLPYIQASQAQKHVTHNEALQILDALVQPAVQSRSLTAAPVLPAAGDRYIVASGATGTWSGQGDRIAVWDGSAWMFLTPLPGWRCHIAAEDVLAVFYAGTGWRLPSELPQSCARLGVNAAPDALNPLTVSGPSTLLNHAGAGHQLKLNKAGATDTASLVFQTGFSGRAEFGLAGSDDFSIKVSGNGSAFATALLANRTSGQLTLPGGALLADGAADLPALGFAADPDTGLSRPAADQIGLSTGGALRAVLSGAALQLDVPLTGLAVQTSAADATASRLMKVGSFGLGGAAIALSATDDLNGLTATGFYYNATASNTTGNNYPLSSAGSLLNLRRSATNWTQLFTTFSTSTNAASTRSFLRSFGTSGWGPWVESYHQGNIVGTVSQSGGVPTGKVIERGSNANGEYLRLADGLQLVWMDNFINQTVAANIYVDAAWSFPAAFVTGSLPAVRATVRSTSDAAGRESAARYLRPVGSPAGAGTGSAGVVNLHTATLTARVDVMAIGRWF